MWLVEPFFKQFEYHDYCPLLLKLLHTNSTKLGMLMSIEVTKIGTTKIAYFSTGKLAVQYKYH